MKFLTSTAVFVACVAAADSTAQFLQKRQCGFVAPNQFLGTGRWGVLPGQVGVGLPGQVGVGLPGQVGVGLPGQVGVGLPGQVGVGLPGQVGVGLPGQMALPGQVLNPGLPIANTLVPNTLGCGFPGALNTVPLI
jgi:hypothetical protein